MENDYTACRRLPSADILSEIAIDLRRMLLEYGTIAAGTFAGMGGEQAHKD
jgi:hypothetical protein